MSTVSVVASANVEAIIKVTDQDGIITKYQLHEGDKITNLVYLDSYGVETTIEEAIIDAIVVAKHSGSVQHSPILDGRPMSMQNNTDLCQITAMAKFVIVPTAMVLDVAEKSHSKHIPMDFSRIVSIGSIDATVLEVSSDALPEGGIASVITDAEDGAEISLLAGTYEAASGMTLDKSITLVGPNDGPQVARTKAATVATLSTDAEATSDIPGAVISGACTINGEDAVVEFRGLSFTGDFRPVIQKAKKVSFINCRFEDVNAPDAKTMLFTSAADFTGIIVIEGCYFGAPAASSAGKMYHITEFNGALTSGSSFSKNYFDLNCCTHNAVNIYNVVEGATINVNSNYIAKSASMSRIGIKGAVKATVNYIGNTYDETDVTPWEGLVTCQPYGSVTTDMSGWTVNINNTVNNTTSDQLVVIYFGASDMPYDETKFPKIYVDGAAYTEYAVINDQATTATETTTTVTTG